MKKNLCPSMRQFLRTVGFVALSLSFSPIVAQQQPAKEQQVKTQSESPKANSSDTPTWPGFKPKSKSDDDTPQYNPPPIDDAFAPNAVTYEQMQLRAKYFPYMPHEIVVAMELNVPKSEAERTFQKYDWAALFGRQDVILVKRLMTIERVAGKSISLVHLMLPSDMEVFQAMRSVNTKTGVLWSSPNFYFNGDPREVTPNDPSYSSQYHHALMKNDLAWNTTYGSPSVKIGIADDGVSLTHSDLSANIWVNSGETAGDGIDNDNNGYIDDVNGWDFVANNNNPNPDPNNGDTHGTHVAGIAGARTNNGVGVAGVAGQSTIVPLQFYNSSSNWTATIVNNCYTYAANNGVKIVNTSYNIDGFVGDATFTAGLQYMYDNGVLNLNSAGNNSQQNPPRQAFEQLLLVASTTSTDALSSFSNYGSGVDISSPGSNIYSTIIGNSYDTYSGTSMATPNAAGVAALIWSAHPTWTRDQVAAQLFGTTDNVDATNPTRVGQMGSGRVNSYAGITATLPAPKVKSITGIPDQGGTAALSTITSFTVSFNQIMDPASVNSSQNFELRNAGSNGIFGDVDDVIYPVTATKTYRIGTNSLTFNIGNTPVACGNYRLTIRSNGVKNPFNTALDGDGNGTGGDNFVRTFSASATAVYYVDADGDTYGTGQPVALCTPQSGYATRGGDCNDNNPNVNPGATEVCNGIDDNCDGIIDTPATTTYTSTDVPKSISTMGTSTVTSTITISGASGTISDVNLKNLRILHSWVGDLNATLTAPNGTSISLFDRPGFPASSFGCANNNISVDFDDAATLTSTNFETTCNSSSTTTTNAISGSYKPINALSAFNGISPNGTWTLTVVDNSNGDGGSIQSWGLEITLPSSQTVLYADSDGDTYGNPNSSITVYGCTSASGYVSNNLDCNDSNANVNPGATEICNNIDDDCDGLIDEGLNCCTTPNIICPSNFSFGATSGCSASPTYTVNITNAPNATITYSITGATTRTGSGTGSGTAFNVGSNTVTVTVATASCGSASCSFTIVVTDNAPPTINCPANITTPAEWGMCVGKRMAFSVTASDNCAGLVTITQMAGLPSGVPFPVGTTTNVFRATDAAGNSSTCSFTVTQRGNITAPADITVTGSGVNCTATNVNLGTPTLATLCGITTHSNNAPSVFPRGVTIVTWQASDFAGNVTTSTQRVTVICNNLTGGSGGSENVRLYPNPSRDVLEVMLKGYEETVVTMTVFDLLGKVVSTRQLSGAAVSTERLELDLMSNGTYYLRVSASGKSDVTQKFVVIK